MKVKVKFKTLQGYADREVSVIVDFADDISKLASFISYVNEQNVFIVKRFLSERQRARIVGFVSNVSVVKFIN